jgi:hypothetical protein
MIFQMKANSHRIMNIKKETSFQTNFANLEGTRNIGLQLGQWELVNTWQLAV